MSAVEEALRDVTLRGQLTRAQMRDVVRSIMNREAPDLQVAALLAALRTRGESTDELAGAAEALRELAVPLPRAPAQAVDTCGTGGGAVPTFNVSTLAALVVAGTGVPVAKHGNRRATSACGSAELIEALGVSLSCTPQVMATAVQEVGIGFLFARACHPAFAAVAGVRSALGIPTLFNRLGPLVHPMGVRRQLVGVSSPEHVESTLEVLIELGAERAWVVHGEDGMDEISTSAPTRVASYVGGRREQFRIEPEQYVPAARPADVRGGEAAENAEIARAVLCGKLGPARDLVLINAGAALCVAGTAANLAEGIAAAARSIDSGAARARLARWVEFTRRACGEAGSP
jgi:anthranilate phosphoribosyltransferase